MNTEQNKTTAVEIRPPARGICPSESIMLLGSCFATEIGRWLSEAGINICNNPFGVLYNPTSIARSLSMMLEGKRFYAEDVIPRDTNPTGKRKLSVEIPVDTKTPPEDISDADSIQNTKAVHRPIAPDGGGFVSFYHHGSFARHTPQEFLEHANTSILDASQKLMQSEWVIITFGTAWVYRHLERDIIVSNCHKHPSWEFRREFMSVEEIVSMWSGLLDKMPEKQIVFTVSPIRHKKDGMHGNQLSKATLLLAIDRLAALYPNVHYFPSYEIVLDELRDYSWYKEDGVHLSEDAIEIICKRFLHTFGERRGSVL